jgi:hypothetical protein
MSNEQKYNGWSNYETWLANLWFDNDEGTQSYIREQAEECLKEAEEEKNFTRRENATLAMRDFLENYVEELQSESGMPSNGLFCDLLSAAIGRIDWYEIAKHHIDDLDLYAAGFNVPGFLPDNEPEQFTDESDAIAHLKWLMNEAAEQATEAQPDKESVIEDDLKAAIETLTETGTGYFIGVAYWFNKV